MGRGCLEELCGHGRSGSSGQARSFSPQFESLYVAVDRDNERSIVPTSRQNTWEETSFGSNRLMALRSVRGGC
jgi:hypothetical protein